MKNLIKIFIGNLYYNGFLLGLSIDEEFKCPEFFEEKLQGVLNHWKQGKGYLSIFSTIPQQYAGEAFQPAKRHIILCWNDHENYIFQDFAPAYSLEHLDTKFEPPILEEGVKIQADYDLYQSFNFLPEYPKGFLRSYRLLAETTTSTLWLRTWKTKDYSSYKDLYSSDDETKG